MVNKLLKSQSLLNWAYLLNIVSVFPLAQSDYLVRTQNKKIYLIKPETAKIYRETESGSDYALKELTNDDVHISISEKKDMKAEEKYLKMLGKKREKEIDKRKKEKEKRKKEEGRKG